MVQRKGPDIGIGNSLATKSQVNKEKPTPSSQDEKKGKESEGMSQLKRKLKKARSIKRVAELGELDAHLRHHPQTKKKPPQSTPKSNHSTTPAAKPRTPSKISKEQQNPGKTSGKSGGGDSAPPPNYMKGTNSSDARKEQQRQVRFRPTTPSTPTPPAVAEKYRTPKNWTPYSNPPKAASTPTPPRSPTPASSSAPPPPIPSMKKSASIKKSAKMLSRKLSLNPIRSLMRKCSEALMFPNGTSSNLTPPKALMLPNSSSSSKPTSSGALMFPDVSTSKPTCSSTLKGSKFPEELELNPGGTQAEGTSAVKVCPFTYCSLNGHCHGKPVPPLKRFVSMRRRTLKKQKTLKLRQLSVKRRGLVTKSLKRVKSRKGASVEVSTAVEMADDGEDGFFIEIYDDPRGGNVDPHLYGGGNGGDDKVKFQGIERAEVATERQEGTIMNNPPFDGTNSTYRGRDDNAEADTRSTTGTQESGQALLKRKSMKLRQLSVRRRSWQKSLMRVKSRRRTSSEIFTAVDLPNNSGDDFFAETYDIDIPLGGNVDPHLYDSSNKLEECGEAKILLTDSAVKDHKVTSSNAYWKNDFGGEAIHQSAKGAVVATEEQKSTEQRFTTRPDSYTELSFDDNFDMISEASFSETEVIEQFLEFIDGTGQEDPPAKETFLLSAHKNRKRWHWGCSPDRNMVFATDDLQDAQDSKLVSYASGTEGEEVSEYGIDGAGVEKYYMLFDDLVGSIIEDLSNDSSTAALMRDPSCEIDVGKTLLHERNEAYFTMMDEIYCSFNSTGSEDRTNKEAKDTSDQKPEEFQEGVAEVVDNEKGEEWKNQPPHQESEFREAEVIPAATHGDDERGLPQKGNNGCTAEISSPDIQAADQNVMETTLEAQQIPDMAQDIEVTDSDSEIIACGEAAKALFPVDDHADGCPVERLSDGSFEGKKGNKDREECVDSINTTTEQRKQAAEDTIPTTTEQRKQAAEDNYDNLARKAIEDSVEEVYIYNVLKGSEGPEIIRAITDAIADPNEGVQGPQSKFKSRYSMTRNKAVQYLDKLRSFHPRPPNFLPVEPDPEAEKIDLRHQKMNDKKDAEEWMIDHALQKVLRRLAPDQKKVTLIVKAYEAVTLAPASENSFQYEDRNFAHSKPLQVQACSE